jgi:hypothetical protein
MTSHTRPGRLLVLPPLLPKAELQRHRDDPDAHPGPLIPIYTLMSETALPTLRGRDG